MSMPIFKLCSSAAACLLLTACGQDNDAALKDAEAAADEAAALDGKVECALAGGENFDRNCTTEQIADAAGNLLVIRHPDGGFRRFRILTDGRGLQPADGFDETSIKLIDGGMIEVSSGGDRYRLPARVKSDGDGAGKDAG